MMKLIIAIVCVFGTVLCDLESDTDHKELHEMATKIMTGLQREHIPSDGSVGSAANAPLHHLKSIHKNHELIDKTDKTKITVSVKGVKFVSVQRNGKFVNISTDFAVGAAAIYSVETIDIESDYIDLNRIELRQALEEQNDKEIDDTLEAMSDEYIEEIPSFSRNETKVILAQKAKFHMKVKPKSKKEVKIGVNHGYIVAAVTNVTKGYTD